MGLIAKKLEQMAAEDGVTEDEFMRFAGGVCECILQHAPNGSFTVILPKTGHRHPLALQLSPSFRDDLVALMYQLRECVPGERTIKMVGVRNEPVELTVRTHNANMRMRA